MRRFLLLPVFLMAALGQTCPPPTPPPATQTPISVGLYGPDGTPVPGVIGCFGFTGPIANGADGVAVTYMTPPTTCDLRADAPGYVSQQRTLEVTSAPIHLPLAMVPVAAASNGPVSVDGHAFADDRGAFNALGASLFWALWGEQHDPDRLDANLDHLQSFGVDYVRILAMVGNAGWVDRRIDPRDPAYWTTVDALLNRLERHGLRAHVTLFADADPDPTVDWLGMPTADRPAFVAAWGDKVASRPDDFQLVEVANEHWQNGLPSDDEVQGYGVQLRGRVAVPVALSAPEETAVAAMYEGWPGIATMHFDRDISQSDGVWRPIRQPWGWPLEYFPNNGQPGLFVNSEPIGPDSSVASEMDPARIALAYVTTFVSQSGAYTYHTGAGIRGGGQADLAQGRRPNIYDYPHTIIAALSHWRNTLPGGLANWTRSNAQWVAPLPEFPWNGFQAADNAGQLVQAYATYTNTDVWAVVLGVRSSFTVTSRWAIDQTVLDPVTGAVIEAASLEPGDVWTVPTTPAGFVIKGVRR